MLVRLIRHGDAIPAAEVAEVGRVVGGILGVTPEMPAEIVAAGEPPGLVEDRSGEDALSVVLTRSAADETVFGEGVGRNRTVWVMWHRESPRTARAILHALGHAAGAGHCPDKSCAMYQFQLPLLERAARIEDAFCGRCSAAVRGSWMFGRLRDARQEPVHSAPQSAIPVDQPRPSVPETPFPDWNLPEQEFFEQVLRHFNH